jgi:hypothetical protein
VTAPRPGDAYCLDVTYPGEMIRFLLDALNDQAAYSEAARILGDRTDERARDGDDRWHPIGVLRRADGAVVASGDTRHFEELSGD